MMAEARPSPADPWVRAARRMPKPASTVAMTINAAPPSPAPKPIPTQDTSEFSRCSFDAIHSAPTRIRIHDGTTPRSSVRYPVRTSASSPPRHARNIAEAARIKVPTSSIAPSTCTSSGKFQASGRIAASTIAAGPRLVDHHDEQDEHRHRAQPMEEDGLPPVGCFCRDGLEAGLGARPKSARHHPQHDRGDHPAVPDLVAIDVYRETD